MSNNKEFDNAVLQFFRQRGVKFINAETGEENKGHRRERRRRIMSYGYIVKSA